MSNSGQVWVVLKFGGTSVASAERWNTISGLVADRLAAGERPLVVCSALAGVSDLLEASLREAKRGEYKPVLAEIEAVHDTLAESLGVSLDASCRALINQLDRTLMGVSLLREATTKQRARVMATGEILASRIGHAFLERRGVNTAWVDARDYLQSVDPSTMPAQVRHLAATCDAARDAEMASQLEALAARAIVTQGFIARDAHGDTVLLGRGGSDTSAAYLAAKLGARRCEIWTDVPGMFTANPTQVPNARLLRALDYNEAQEIASTGARVLHPRCLGPLARARIPLHVRCTPRPDLDGTVVATRELGSTPQVKAISARRGVTLISMDTIGMWHEVGFLADVFGIFKRHGISIDLLSTSETNVTVSLDPERPLGDDDALAQLIAELSAFCTVREIGPCAAVSLVGNRIRGMMHRLGPALESFEEQEIHLVTQAASDLNLTFVVDEDQADRLVTRLHNELVTALPNDTTMGPTWEALSRGRVETPSVTRWWHGKVDELIALAQRGTPTYVYDAASVRAACRQLRGIAPVSRVFYAIKANPHPDILRIAAEEGLGLECVSPGEIEHCLAVVPDLAPDRILFTPNFAPRSEYEVAFRHGVHVTLDNLHPLEHWPDLFCGREVMVRIDPGQGRGHHQHVRTAGTGSKFGVSFDQLDALASLATAAGVKIVGLHAHTGSGIRTPDNWRDTALTLLDAAARFPDVRALDVGGGLGVPEKAGQASLDLKAVAASLAGVQQAHPEIELWLEPGRFVVATAGVLLTRVTQLKHKGELLYVGVDAGMNSLLRPALYGAWHDIVNISGLARDPSDIALATVVGPICESGDTLGRRRQLHRAREGDVVLIDVVGAYGRAMASQYNLRAPASEVMWPATDDPRPS
ncbi:MAG: bifunctional aspartate kinase/diaminopimelate decarboxylase [Myxococcales bacterium FL481]|nr:MAG: bifunctional aspartate kinase/diaminopimelate decarboxylase [Myxococcales bacterium FL481]